MEEVQIQEFVHRVKSDPILRQALEQDPATTIAKLGYPPRVEKVVIQLVPLLLTGTLQRKDFHPKEMEEQLIQDFVERVNRDPILRQGLTQDLDATLAKLAYPERVNRVVIKLVPMLLAETLLPRTKSWWV